MFNFYSITDAIPYLKCFEIDGKLNNKDRAYPTLYSA